MMLCLYVGSIPTVSESSSTVMIDYSPQRQHNILVISQQSSLASFVSNSHTTISPATTIKFSTTRSTVVTCTGQNVSVITTAGV